jgi:uncharacterized protein
MKLLIFGLVNLLAATLSGAAGGGGGLISLPLLVTLGLSPATAIATSKFGGFGIAAGTSVRFFQEKLVDRRTAILFSVMGAVAAVAGSFGLLALQHHEQLLQSILGITILVIGIPLLYIRNLGLKPVQRSVPVKLVGGMLMMSMFGMTALVATATRRVMQLVVATVSLGIFVVAGVVDYKYGVVGLITSGLGGFLGAHIAVKKGNKFVINLFAITSAILAIQLLWR